MTGFGQKQTSFPKGKVSVEIKTLNSKYLDLNLKYPSGLKDKEHEMRKIIQEKLVRGKVDCVITFELEEIPQVYKFNESVIEKYYKDYFSLMKKLEHKGEVDMRILMSLPDVTTKAENESSNEHWEALKNCLTECCDLAMAHRKNEGTGLLKEFEQSMSMFLSSVEKVKLLDKNRIVLIKQRIENQIKKHLNEKELDTARLEQEMIYYLEKIDINEEISRLNSHIRYFSEVLEDKNLDKGKKLNFISQELGREINTLGAKSYDADMQRLVVEMKDELEKIKEQVLNVL